jgi:hypothetical protein
VDDEFTILTWGEEAGSQTILGAISLADGLLLWYSRFSNEADYLTLWQVRTKFGVAGINQGNPVWNRGRGLRNRIYLQQSRRCTAREHEQ